MEFLMFIGKDNFKVFDLENRCERVLFRGRDYFSFELTKIQIAIEELFDILKNDFNINNDNNIYFHVLENNDELINKVVFEAMDGHIRNRHKLQGAMVSVMAELSQIEGDKLMIKKYGINYDDKCFKFNNNAFLKRDFSLLAYTISEDILIEALLQSKR